MAREKPRQRAQDDGLVVDDEDPGSKNETGIHGARLGELGGAAERQVCNFRVTHYGLMPCRGSVGGSAVRYGSVTIW